MFTQKRKRIIRILLIGLLAGSILVANAAAASADTSGSGDPLAVSGRSRAWVSEYAG